MGKIKLLAHISLDGFVARTDRSFEGFEAGEDNLQYVCDLTKDATAAMLGRNSYELLQQYWPDAKSLPHASSATIEYSNWYNHAKKIIVSKSYKNIPLTNSIILNELTKEELISMKSSFEKDILLFGSPAVAQQLMQMQLIDDYYIFINPVFFGDGIPLFDKMPFAKLRLKSTTTFDNGEVVMHCSAVDQDPK